jgi:prevent-host-death family protein
MKTLNATTFKATCLAVLDDVAETGAVYTITKRGRRVAQVGPPALATPDYPQATMTDEFEILGDIVSPILEPDAWEANRSLVAEPAGANARRSRKTQRTPKSKR